MKLVHIGDYYVFKCNYDERMIAKDAGFKWNPDAKSWITQQTAVALNLIDYADDTLRNKLLNSKESAMIAQSYSMDTDMYIDTPPDLKPYPFQSAGISSMIDMPNILLADEMGLGKTIQAICLVNMDKTIRRVLVICPASLKLNWKHEIETWCTRRGMITVIHKENERRNELYDEPMELPETDNPVTWYIINYERLERKYFELIDYHADTIICDEAHYLKNWKAKRTSNTAVLMSKEFVKRKILLTGTPLLNRPIELFPLLHILGQAYAMSYWPFAKRYANAHQTQYGWDVSGASNIPELNSLLRSTVMIRRTKAEVLKDLPPKQRQIIAIPSEGYDLRDDTHALRHSGLLRKILDSKATIEYDLIVQELQSKAEELAMIDKARLKTALQKLPDLIDFVKDMDGQVVIFAHHREVIQQLTEALPDSVVITGETPSERRQDIVDTFQRGGVKYFIGSIHACGVGITLTASSNVVFAELDWTPSNVSQAEDRCHRIGQRDSVNVYHVVVNNSIDAYIARMLVNKQALIDKVMK